MSARDVLTIASAASDDPQLRPLPESAAELLRVVGAPPRLVAHLRAVHEVAGQLVEWVELHCSEAAFDRDAVLFGAATHDIGKALHPEELSGPGSRHEERGRQLLLEHGVSAAFARFAGTHGSWESASVGTEDLLVSLADKVWKDKRVPALEDRVVAVLAGASGREAWEEFLRLDDFLARVGAGAAARLAYQASYPIRG